MPMNMYKVPHKKKALLWLIITSFLKMQILPRHTVVLKSYPVMTDSSLYMHVPDYGLYKQGRGESLGSFKSLVGHQRESGCKRHLLILQRFQKVTDVRAHTN